MAKNKPTLRSRYSKAAIKVRRQIKRAGARAGGQQIRERYEGEYPTLRQLGNISDEDLMSLTTHAEGLLKTGTLTLRHQKQMREGIETLVKNKYDLDPEDASALWDFLADAQARGLANFYGYEEILVAVNRARRRELSKSEIIGNIDYWIKAAQKAKEKGEKLKELRVYKGRSPSSSHAFRRK